MASEQPATKPPISREPRANSCIRTSAEEQRLNERIAKMEFAIASEQESAPFFHTPLTRMLAPILRVTSTQDFRILVRHAKMLIEVPPKFLRLEGRRM